MNDDQRPIVLQLEMLLADCNFQLKKPTVRLTDYIAHNLCYSENECYNHDIYRIIRLSIAMIWRGARNAYSHPIRDFL